MSADTSVRPPTTVDLVWDGDLRFTARAGDTSIVLDSAGVAGPSPMQALAHAMAACMAMDVVHVLDRSRVPATAMRVGLSGERAEGYPARFVRIDLRFDIDAPAADEVVERAIALSRSTYCSVWNSMRQDIELSTSFTVHRG
jgi:putative redox protein